MKRECRRRLLSKHFCLQPFFPKDWVFSLFIKSVNLDLQIVGKYISNIFQCLYFYLYSNVWPFIFNVILFMEHQYSTLHGTLNRDDYGIVQWNSLGPGFHLKIDAFFIYVQTMGLDLILYWKTCNYRKVNLLNLKMLLCA